jgi:hypothetical protein
MMLLREILQYLEVNGECMDIKGYKQRIVLYYNSIKTLNVLIIIE